jgi:SAM-dependent methyltransferase
VKAISSKEQFDRQSKLYAESPIHLQGPSLPYLVEYAQPIGSEFVLDIATGTGSTAFAIAPHVSNVVGIDLAEKMLSQARRLAAERGITNIDFQVGNAEGLPFPDQTFDLVTARHAPHHFLDADAFVRETRRVLKPSGRFVLVDQISLNSEVQEWTNNWEKTRDPSHFYQRTVEEWKDLADRAGLSWIRHTFVPYRMEFNWWVRQAGVTAEGTENLKRLARNASQAESDAVNLEFVDGEVTAFTSQMMVVRMEPNPSSLT